MTEDLHTETAMYRTRIDANIDAIFKIAEWIRDNPNCRPDMKQDKLRLWDALARENAMLGERWDETRDRWLKERLNQPRRAGDVADELIGGLRATQR